MSTATFIRRHINNLTHERPFSIRDFLTYGTRPAVDQVFYRLVKCGRIKRVARGVFIKETAPFPSALEVAEVKALAFGKRITMHAKDILTQFGLSIEGADGGNRESSRDEGREKNRDEIRDEIRDESRDKGRASKCKYFACNGRSSSFQFGDTRIYLVGIGARKFFMENHPVGCFIRAVWYVGKNVCDLQVISTLSSRFNRIERQILRKSAWIMPAWMHEAIPTMSRAYI